MSDHVPTPNLPVSTVMAPVRFRLVPSDLVTLDGIKYVPVSSDDNGHILARAEDRKFLESFTHAKIDDLHRRGVLEVRHDHFGYDQLSLDLKHVYTGLPDLPEKRRNRLLARKNLCDDFLRAEHAKEVTRSDKSISTFVKTRWMASVEDAMALGRHGGKNLEVARPPSPTTVRRWLKVYESCGFKPMSLCDDYVRSGNFEARFNSELSKLIEKAANLYQDRKQPSVRSTYLKLKDSIKDCNALRKEKGEDPLPVPSRTAFSRAIDRLDPFQVYAARNSVEAAKKKFFIVHRGAEVTRPLERVEADGNKIPVQTILQASRIWESLELTLRDEIERGRWIASMAIDAATRCVLGFVLVPTADSASAIETVRMTVTDKRDLARSLGCGTAWDMFGSFETIVTDNGSEYANEAFQSVVLSLGAEASYPPAGMPQLRGIIERFFGTIHTGLFSKFSGRTFANVVAKGNYKPEEHAALLLDEVWRLIVRWIVDVYHNSPHEGLLGETPREAWLRLTELYPVIPPPSPDVARHIFGVTVQRKIGNHGVRVLGLNYQSIALQRLRRDVRTKPVRVRLDRDDIGHVSVEVGPGEWLTVECVRDGFDGISANHWMETLKVLRRRHTDMAKLSEDIVFRALRDIEATVRAAEVRNGISYSLLSPEATDAFERDVAMSFEFDRGEDDPPLFGDEIPDGPKPSPTDDAAAVAVDEVRPTVTPTFILED